MGMGCGKGSSAGATRNRARSLRISVFLFAAIFALLVAASILLGARLRRHAQQALAPVPAFPFSSVLRPSLPPASLGSNPSEVVRSNRDARSILGHLPLIFEANQGQADGDVKFLARGAGYGLFLDSAGATLAFQTPTSSRKQVAERWVRMKLVGANPGVITSGASPLPGKTNYILGNDPQKWHSGIPQFAGVRYAGVYPLIDLIFYGNQGHLEYDFRVAPGGNPAQAELAFEGASKLELRHGDLILTDDRDGGLRLQAPQIYQRDGDRRRRVSGRFVIRGGNRVGFEIGAYDHSRELIIDPILTFSTYFGGSGTETSPTVAVNGDGYIYVVGSTTVGTGFPTTTASTTIGSAAHVFVTKINPTGPAVVYLTFLGGNGTDSSIGIGVDAKGFTYIAGNTTSSNFPTSPTSVLGYQQSPATKGRQCSGITCDSIFVSVLDNAGSSLFYSSYLSGNGNDVASGMAIDLNGDIYVTGSTTSNDAPSLTVAFPATLTPVPFQTQPDTGSSIQFFVTKVDTSLPGASGIAYSTYFGGATPAGAIAVGGGITVDPIGNIYFSGTTNFFNSGLGPYGDSSQPGTDFPILNAYQPCLDTPPPLTLPISSPCTAPTSPYPTDAFMAKIDPNVAAGAQLQFSTYLGAQEDESSTGIAIDAGAANIYLVGTTNSPTIISSTTTTGFNFPPGSLPYQLCLNQGLTVTVQPCPTTNSNTDAFVARMTNPTMSTTGIPNDVQLSYFTYLGGGGNDTGSAIAVLDTASTTLNDVVVTGATNSGTSSVVSNPPAFPVTATCPTPPCVLQSTLNGTQNGFYAQINTTTTTGGTTGGSYVTYFGGNGVDSGTGVAVDPNQNGYLVGQTTSSTLQVAGSFPGAGGSSLNGVPPDAFIVKWGTATDLSVSSVPPIISPIGTVSAGNQVTITYTVSNQGPDPATNITISGLVTQPATFNSASIASGTCSTPTGSTVVCQIPTLQAGSTTTVEFVVTPMQEASYQVTATVSAANNTNTANSEIASFNAGGYTMQINPASQTVVAGLPATYSVTVSPLPLFPAAVSLSCSSLPTGATCNFTTKSLVLNGPQSTVLNITTTAQPVPVADSRPGRRSLYAMWLMVPGLALWGLGARGKRRRRWLLIWLGLCVVCALISLLPACGHPTPQPTVSGTPSGTYPLTVTATSGSFTQSVPFTLTVTP
jgi:hypothetical protein